VLFTDLRESPHLLNTFGAVEVFRRAFPLTSQPVQAAPEPSPRLLILVHNTSASAVEWQWLQALYAYDPRIQIRDNDGLPLSQSLGLIAGADVFFSLQRSYALPSLLAFAQTTGLQVIASATGAALDLPASANLHRVPVRLVPISRGAAPDADGFLWGEPNQEAAIKALQQAVAKACCRQRPAEDLDASCCGEVLKARLQQLWRARRPDDLLC
jgi:hypothetical protein